MSYDGGHLGIQMHTKNWTLVKDHPIDYSHTVWFQSKSVSENYFSSRVSVKTFSCSCNNFGFLIAKKLTIFYRVIYGIFLPFNSYITHVVSVKIFLFNLSQSKSMIDLALGSHLEFSNETKIIYMLKTTQGTFP